MTSSGARTIVIGVGNPYRRDDGVGAAVVSRLRERRVPGVELVECEAELSALIECWTGASLAVVVDAIRTRPSHPGRVHRLSAHHPAAAHATATASSHGLGLGEAVDLARMLDRMPRRLLVFAVEAEDLGFGFGLTEPVAAAADQVAAEIVELVGVGVG